MTDSAGGGPLLPYRSTPEELGEWLEERARGTSRGTKRSPKTEEGLAATAVALGFCTSSDELTRRGGEYALAREERRAELLREAVLRFEPYARLLAAVRARGEAETETAWVETWWATHGYGGSASNRSEGAAALGRLLEAAKLGRYIPGRRGYPTRVRWEEPAELAEAGAVEPPQPVAVAAAPAEPPAPVTAGRQAPVHHGDHQLEVDLGEGRSASIRVPRRLSGADKRRLLQLLDLLITEE